MNKAIKIAVGAVVLGAIAFVGVSYPKPVVQNLSFGARPGPDTDAPCTSMNGLTRCAVKKPLNTATTTPCAILSPSSTSTLTWTAVQVNVASSTATSWTPAKATSPYATTTALNGPFSLSSGVRGTMVATSSTLAAVDGAAVISPNTYIVWGLAGMISPSAGDTTKLTGSCFAEFLVN